MGKGTTYVALDDSKRRIVAGILRPGATTPELRELPNNPPTIRRVFERLQREGPVAACYEAAAYFPLVNSHTAVEFISSFHPVPDRPLGETVRLTFTLIPMKVGT